MQHYGNGFVKRMEEICGRYQKHNWARKNLGSSKVVRRWACKQKYTNLGMKNDKKVKYTNQNKQKKMGK